jgi:hypothetical protein
VPLAVDAGRARLDRMKLLRDFCRPDFEQLREEFLDCLTRADDHCVAEVYCCIATKSSPLGRPRGLTPRRPE